MSMPSNKRIMPKNIFDSFFNIQSPFDYNDPNNLFSDMSPCFMSDDDFPPMNVTSLDKNNRYYVQLAVAGFNKDDIDVTLEESDRFIKNKTLSIRGEKKRQSNENSNRESPLTRSRKKIVNDEDFNKHINEGGQFVTQQIASRSFYHKILISNDDEIEKCNMVDGVLNIRIKRNEPTSSESGQQIEIEDS